MCVRFVIFGVLAREMARLGTSAGSVLSGFIVCVLALQALQVDAYARGLKV